MKPNAPLVALLALATLAMPSAFAADNPELQQLRQEIDNMRSDYETRLRALEARLKQAEAAPTASAAPLPAPSPPSPPPTSTAPASPNGFNPAIALILSGTYANLSQDPTHYRINGFLTGAEIGPGARAFSLGESELSIAANIDPWFYGAMNLSLAADNTASVEEAFIQTTSLPAGMTLRAGRFLSGIGYTNEKHAHTWDFVDSPLVYQAFLEGQLKQDGLQLRALLPTDQFIELGAELGAAGPFPSGGSNGNQPGTAALFAHTGGDIGVSQSWRAGLSYLWAKAHDRSSDDIDSFGNSVTNLFSGNSKMLIVDGVWKWAPNGNPQRTNLMLQGEYMRRVESGSLSYDSSGAALTDSYRSTQSGWYTQAVYQFMPAWRVGLRYDRLDIGSVDAASNTGNLFLPDRSPTRASLMLDWSPSEFSRVRLQFANDRARYGITDNQVFIQYQMSLGAHGAHSY